MTLLITTVLPVAGNVKLKNISKELDINSLSEISQVDFFDKKIAEFRDRAYDDWIIKTQQTSDGGYIGIGLTESYGEGDYDAWSIKTDSNGDETWNKTYGEETREWALGGQQTSDGGYILVGSYILDIYLVKTFSNGNEDWSKTFGNNYKEHGSFIQQTSDSGYIIVGRTTDTPVGTYDIWLIKTDSNGDEEWNKKFGGNEQDYGFVVREIDDGYILTGKVGTQNDDVCLIKTDSNGNELWNKTYGGSNSDGGHDVRQTTDEGYIIIGWTCSYGDGDYDFYLIKTDSYGNEEWNKTFDGADAQTAIEIMGFSSGMCVLESSNGYIMMGITDASYGSGGLDILVIETDENGNELWNQTYGGEYTDEGYWMDQTSDDGYILCGATRSYGSSGLNAWLVKIDSNGDEDWNKTFGGCSPVNHPPDTPSRPDGPENGFSGVEYTFNTSTDDPDGDDLYYLFDWGDGDDSGWVGPYSSGSIGSASHSWDAGGEYIIKAKAKDVNNEESEWSSTSTINIVEYNTPPYKPMINGPSNGKVGNSYTYTFSAKDPEGHDVSLYVDWGDDSNTGWLEYVESETDVTLDHIWNEKGIFTIRCKAKDIYNAESEWKEFTVTIPRDKVLNNLFLTFLQSHPYLFPLLQKLIQQIGLGM